MDGPLYFITTLSTLCYPDRSIIYLMTCQTGICTHMGDTEYTCTHLLNIFIPSIYPFSQYNQPPSLYIIYLYHNRLGTVRTWEFTEYTEDIGVANLFHEVGYWVGNWVIMWVGNWVIVCVCVGNWVIGWVCGWMGNCVGGWVGGLTLFASSHTSPTSLCYTFSTLHPLTITSSQQYTIASQQYNMLLYV